MNSEISIFDLPPAKPKRHGTRISSRFIDRTKTHCVYYNGEIVSWHIGFYNAQTAVDKHLRSGRINNGYEILAQNQLDCKHKHTKNGYCLDCLRDLEASIRKVV